VVIGLGQLPPVVVVVVVPVVIGMGAFGIKTGPGDVAVKAFFGKLRMIVVIQFLVILPKNRTTG
jgi:hypothetical protein